MKLLLLLPALVAAFTVVAADKKATNPKAAKAKPYPLKICVVTDDELKKDAFTYVYQGREIKLCCDECKKDFEKEPAKYVKILEAAEKQQAADKAKQPKKK